MIKPRNFMVAMLVAARMIFMLAGLSLAVGGCAGKPTATVAQVAATAPGLAQQLDSVYAYLVAQKLVPDHTAAATQALAALDAVAPMVQQGATTLSGDNVNWVQFVMQAALTAAQIMGYVAPLLL